MGKDKKTKKNREEKLDDEEEVLSSETKVAKNGKIDSGEESELEIITLEQQGKQRRKKTKKSHFSLLEVEGGSDNDDDKDIDVDDEKPKKSETDEGKKSKQKKSKKKEKKKRNDEDDEDLDKLLEELRLEADGIVPEKPKPTQLAEEVEASAVPDVKPPKKSKKPKVVEEENTEQDATEGAEAEKESSTVKTAAQKKKEKKEREKQKKIAQYEQNALKKKAEPKPQKESSAEPVAEVPEEENVEEKKEETGKKKKKKVVEEDEKKDKKRPGKKMIAAMQEALKKVQEEEERIRLEDEAKMKAAEEAERLREEKLQLEKERKERKKQKEKEKRDRLKAEGKLLTKTQKQNRARMEATLAAFREQGVDIPQVGEKKDRGPRLGDRKKMPKRKTLTSDSTQDTKEEESAHEASPEVEVPSEEKQPTPVPSDEENVKEAWDDSSSEEEEVIQPKTKVKIEIRNQKINSQSKTAKDKASDSESESEEESDSEDGSESSEETSESSEDEDEGISTAEKVRLRIEKRRIEAEANTSLDKLRSPVVCVLGHVDTGKTKILDKIRSTNVQDHEAGGITQQIGATMVPHEAIQDQCKMVKNFPEKELKVPGLLIIDTPGHESFSNLRSRGSSLCDIAILVVDIMHGLEPQTLESINMLKQRKTPFIVALNKIDRVYEWKSTKNKDIQDVMKSQSRVTKQFFDDRVKQIVLEFANQSLNAVLFYENPDPKSYVSMVPTSAMTGEGMGNLMALIVELTQTMMAKRIMFSEELQATVLEVKAIGGLGHTMDTILVNGRLKEGDTIVFAGFEGPMCSQIRSLLLPQPLKELRVKCQFIEHREIEGAQGIKICGRDFEKAIAGLPLLVPKKQDEVPILMEEIADIFKQSMNAIKVTGTGVYVQASTLGSLEALMEFLTESKIPVSGVKIGPVTKKDVMKASVMLEHDPTYAVILAFDVRIERESQELADSLNIKIFHANIIYHLFDAFVKYRTDIKDKNREQFKSAAVFPCKLKILPQYVFNSRDPIVMGVSVEAGVLKEGTPICVPSKEFLDVGVVTTIEINHKGVDTARKGQEVCIKIESCGGDAPKMYGRHFDHTDMLVSKISRNSIDICKEHFRDDLQKTDWQLMVELKKLFQIV